MRQNQIVRETDFSQPERDAILAALDAHLDRAEAAGLPEPFKEKSTSAAPSVGASIARPSTTPPAPQPGSEPAPIKQGRRHPGWIAAAVILVLLGAVFALSRLLPWISGSRGASAQAPGGSTAIKAPDSIQFSCNKAFLQIEDADGRQESYENGNRFSGSIELKDEGMVGEEPAYRQFRVPYSEQYRFSSGYPGLSMEESSTAAFSSFSGDGITEAVWTLQGWRLKTEPGEMEFHVIQNLPDPDHAYVLIFRLKTGPTVQLTREEGSISIKGVSAPAILRLHAAEKGKELVLPAFTDGFTIYTDRLDEGLLVFSDGEHTEELSITWEE